MPRTSEAVPKPGIAFHHGAILDALGWSPRAIVAALRIHLPDYPAPTEAAIYQWVSRSRIGGDWLAVCLYAALQSGKLKPERAFIKHPVHGK